MNEPLSTERQRQLLRDLFDRVAVRVQSEQSVESDRVARAEVAESEFAAASSSLTERYEAETAAIEEEYDRVRQEVGSQFILDHGDTQEEFEERLFEIEKQFETESSAANKQHEETRWMVNSVFDDSANDSPKQQFDLFKSNLIKTKERLQEQWTEMEQMFDDAVALLRRRRQWRDYDAPRKRELPEDPIDLHEHFDKSVETAQQQLAKLRRQKLGRIFIGWWPYLIFLLLWSAISAGVFTFVDPQLLKLKMPQTDPLWIGIIVGAVLAVCGLGIAVLYAVATKRATRAYLPLQQSMADAKRARHQWQQHSKDELQRRQKEFQHWYALIVEERDTALQKADDTLARKMAVCTQTKESELHEAGQKYPALLEQITSRRDQKLKEADDEFPRRLAALTDRHNSSLSLVTKKYDQQSTENQEHCEREWNALFENWHSGLEGVQRGLNELNEHGRVLFPEWRDLASGDWSVPTDIPHGIRIGQHAIDLHELDNGMPDDPRLAPVAASFPFPALLPFPESPSLLIKADGIGRDQAVKTIQVAMLRLLTSLPPGKVRFTLIDPVGLGENFSAFMHLADYDELLISSRIWTEGSHIEKRLANLTEHMETVFQTYLRNEFQSIEEYNEHAGEVAEPYHILVAANFPVNFNETAARRLASIASSGARCGVYTLVSVDTTQPMPHKFNLADLEQYATNLVWQKDHFVWKDADYEHLPLVLDAPPTTEDFGDIVRAAGNLAKDARRVEVAFDRIAPKDDRWWSQDSRFGIDVPLGRAGATKLQHMRLGKGTSQHVMIAGKTGSGKSTFLHALITNLALHYSPHEVEFYLIDFKKGVEFKTYAANALPHARVIAIESDREFGLSVLQRLDSVLKERGDLFRDHGVQDVGAFRDANPDSNMPRQLLMIDEFQEFFVEDDKIAQNASLLLDRLVRQGRAFGIHVLLGSQTLGGAYSLARSTLGQVAVRVALQCSESDAHLILSEENTAARLLTRPGEAIYNDANGLLEGNHPFQIAWLDDSKREVYLQRLHALAEERQLDTIPPIVFEGNIPANPLNNHWLRRIVQTPTWNQKPVALKTWLGEAVAIKDPTTVTFRRQSGLNLLIVGQAVTATFGIVSTQLVSLAAQIAPRAAAPTADETGETGASDYGSQPAQFYIFDGSNEDSRESAAWRRLSELLPHHVKISGPRHAGQMLGEVAEEMKRRETDDRAGEPMFLFVFNLGRFRDLRKDDEDFGFGGFDKKDKPVSAAKNFADLLRDGPSLGIHTIIWSDTYNNVHRWISSQTLREFEMRIVLQMSATDSSNLIDTPTASHLGTNRALLNLVEQGTLEKFRPYGTPSDEWLNWVETRFQGAPPEPGEPEPAETDSAVETDSVETGEEVEFETVAELEPDDDMTPITETVSQTEQVPEPATEAADEAASTDDEEGDEFFDDISMWTVT